MKAIKHIIISKDAEKLLKIQHTFIIEKTLKKVRGNIPQHNTGYI